MLALGPSNQLAFLAASLAVVISEAFTPKYFSRWGAEVVTYAMTRYLTVRPASTIDRIVMLLMPAHIRHGERGSRRGPEPGLVVL